MNLLKDLYENRRLILKLSKNDFKTRYAGSYLGIIWAFVQPIVTILVYWFVFQKALKVGSTKTTSGIDIPYVLWLTTGLVPWFFFSEALNNGTNALIEYNYLVKKVVFNISVLPVIKLLSALLVHVFFVVFTLILFSCYGYFPDLYVLQVVYYSFALFVLCLAVTYATCSVVIFFRDLTQIISIVLQVGMWATPILWNLSTTVPENWQWIFKANPVYYIVKGYRDALIDKQWFWQDWRLTLYFWAVTLLIYWVATVIFKRLRPHFADVL
ncbi:MAG: ABC transporter permease [Lachnospiraceae bacterium]|nr:ABC transporter permease [Lachnospiraceae bacterium]